jgi:hypothetical protein
MSPATEKSESNTKTKSRFGEISYLRTPSVNCARDNAFHRMRFVKCVEPVRCGLRSLNSRRRWRPSDVRQKHARSIGAASSARKGQDIGVARLVDNAIELRNQAALPPAAASFLPSARALGFCRQPTLRNPLCSPNVGHQMITDPRDRALRVIFPRIK